MKITLKLIVALPFIAFDIWLYVVSLQWVAGCFSRKAVHSVEVGEESITRSRARRHPAATKALVTSIYDDGRAQTLFAVLRLAVRQYGALPALVSRHFVEMKKLKETDKFPSKIYDDNKIEEITYQELGEQTLAFGVGLRVLGMEPIPQTQGKQQLDDLSGKFTLVIFEDTCKYWSLAMHGAFTQSFTVATCYATLGEEAVVGAVEETNATALLCNWKKVERFAALVGSGKMQSLKIIVCSTYEMPHNTAIPTHSKVRIISTDSLIELGASKLVEYPPTPPQPTDLAVIMYTSGSTGKPKGVMMQHQQLVAASSGISPRVGIRKGKETYISYLPLAHVLALQAETGMLAHGGKICYSDPRQLITTMPMFKPTIHAGVPKVWELFKAGLEKKMSLAPKAMKLAFEVAFEWKTIALSLGIDTPLFNLLFKKISAKLFGGNQLRVGISGGGPLSASLQNFCRVCFCCPLVQGYALTETCCGGTFQALSDPRSGIIGGPVSCVEIALQSEPDIKDSHGLGYLHTDTRGAKGEEVAGRGEILIRGPCISSGYYKMPEKTASEYEEDGWFHTGDIGQFTTCGVLQIVDRKKNLVKLKGGEYVAVEGMESAYAASPFATAVCVIARGDLDRPLLLVTTDNAYLENWAHQQKVEYSSLAELVSQKQTKDAVLADMKTVGKEAGLTSLELGLKDCVLITDREWLPGAGMTATMKIDRKVIHQIHEKQLDAMLKANGVPHGVHEQ